jgi:hypothetical protein
MRCGNDNAENVICDAMHKSRNDSHNNSSTYKKTMPRGERGDGVNSSCFKSARLEELQLNYELRPDVRTATPAFFWNKTTVEKNSPQFGIAASAGEASQPDVSVAEDKERTEARSDFGAVNPRTCGRRWSRLIQLAGTSTGAPLSFTKNTTIFAGLVWLAFRPTT